MQHRTALRRLSAIGLSLAAMIGVGLAVANHPGPWTPATADDPAQTSDSACRDRDDGQTVTGIDLDGDGLDDRAQLNEADQILIVCLGNSETRRGSTDDEGWVGERTAVKAVDLGGTPGIALIHNGDGGL